MAAGQPGVLVDHAAEPLSREPVIGALPQRPEGASPTTRSGSSGRRSGPQISAMRYGMPAPQVTPWIRPRGAFEHAVKYALGRRHLPQDVHVDAAFAARPLVGDARLLDAAGDRVGDQLLVPLAAGPAVIDLRDRRRPSSS